MNPGKEAVVADGVRRVIAPNPGKMTGPGTNTYLIGETQLAVIDPGPDIDAHLECLLELYADRIAWVVVTHSHLDHSPLSRRLAAATGAPIIGFGPPPAPSGSGPTGIDPHDGDFLPDRRFADGDRLDLGDCRLAAVWTPGHASNHLCLELEDTGLLFSGDHVMSGSTVVIAPPDGDMTTYLESLEKVRRLHPRRIAPGHGPMIDDPGAVLDDYLRHRRERETQIFKLVEASDDEPVSIQEVVENLYSEVPASLHPVARYTVWAHLRKLASEGRTLSPNIDDINAPWMAASRAVE